MQIKARQAMGRLWLAWGGFGCSLSRSRMVLLLLPSVLTLSQALPESCLLSPPHLLCKWIYGCLDTRTRETAVNVLFSLKGQDAAELITLLDAAEVVVSEVLSFPK